jgi:hypothetical protein
MRGWCCEVLGAGAAAGGRLLAASCGLRGCGRLAAGGCSKGIFMNVEISRFEVCKIIDSGFLGIAQ